MAWCGHNEQGCQRCFSRNGRANHVPDEGVDSGTVLAVEEIFFQPGESLEAFEARVHEVEHRLLVETLRRLLAE
jgi:folate-dependent phosphoribosylglycinamide formyltransferase PurN